MFEMRYYAYTLNGGPLLFVFARICLRLYLDLQGAPMKSGRLMAHNAMRIWLNVP